MIFKTPSEEIAYIEASLQLHQQRREQYRLGLLQVCMDGEPVGEFDARARKAWRLQLPRWASSVEVYGYDAEGPLLLAVFPVAGVASYAVGRTVQFLLTVIGGGEEILSKDCVTLTYVESPCTTALTLWAGGRQRLRQLPRYLGQWATVAVNTLARDSRRGAGWSGHRRRPVLEDVPLPTGGQPLPVPVVRWRSPLWPQTLQVATAADAAAREHTFYFSS